MELFLEDYIYMYLTVSMDSAFLHRNILMRCSFNLYSYSKCISMNVLYTFKYFV